MSSVGRAVAVAEGPRGEALLVERVRDGDDTAFEELYRRYQRRIRNFVASRVGDSARAEDVTQEAFMSALRGLRASDAEIAWRPWLYEIARNATIDFHRRHRRHEEVSVDRDLMRPLDRRRLVASRSPETELDVKEALDHLRGAFDEVPPNQHRVLVMRELEGLSYREMAEQLNVTHAAVESKLFRARRRLRHEYEELAAGRRCSAVRDTITLMAEGVDARQDRSRVARHARRCSPCRRHARELGVDPFGRRPWQSRVAAFLPLGWLLRRSPAGTSRHGEMLLGNGGQLSAGLAERSVALVTAAALGCAGSLSLGSAPPANARRSKGGGGRPRRSQGPRRVEWGRWSKAPRPQRDARAAPTAE
jgi:RNA polymerase sigma factor (sigma-70 family)